MVQRHVRDGAVVVARQRALIARLRASSLPLDMAEALLANFEDMQDRHEAHLERAEGGVPRSAMPVA